MKALERNLYSRNNHLYYRSAIPRHLHQMLSIREIIISLKIWHNSYVFYIVYDDYQSHWNKAGYYKEVLALGFTGVSASSRSVVDRLIIQLMGAESVADSKKESYSPDFKIGGL